MLKYSVLDFICEFEKKAILPKFKGNIIRGALGNSLRQICCPIKRVDCKDCLLSSSCIYFYIFESKLIKRPRGSPSTPHPFVLDSFDMEKTLYMPQEDFSFRLILFGGAVKWIPYIVYAVTYMGERGIGKGRKDGLGRFDLKWVKQDGHEIYTSKTKVLTNIETDNYLELHDSEVEISKLQVDFITPYRVKFKNALVSSFDFGILIRAALRRISNLEFHFLGEEPDLDYKGLVHRANNIELLSEEKQWIDLSRFSFRQGSKMKIGGLVGRAIYKGKLSEFYPILKYCEIAHVGKQTSFGFGKIKLTIL